MRASAWFTASVAMSRSSSTRGSPNENVRAVFYVEPGDFAGLQGLDELDTPLGFDLPLRDRMDVDVADEGPSERDQGEGFLSFQFRLEVQCVLPCVYESSCSGLSGR
jgi:hypothetical protein